jgi:hypothetical protein
MKAISLWEPWASLIRTGAKTYETRSWPTRYRGELLICAAKGGLPQYELIAMVNELHIQGGLAPLIGEPLDLKAGLWPGVKIEHLNFGKAVAIVNLVDCIKTDDMKLSDIEIQKHFGNFNLGRYAWKLKLIEAIKPFPVKGSQGFFEVPDEVIKKGI